MRSLRYMCERDDAVVGLWNGGQRHHALDGLGVAFDVAFEDRHRHGRRQLEAVAFALALERHGLALVTEIAHVVLGNESVPHVLVVLDEEGREAQRLEVVQSVTAVALATLDRPGRLTSLRAST